MSWSTQKRWAPPASGCTRAAATSMSTCAPRATSGSTRAVLDSIRARAPCVRADTAPAAKPASERRASTSVARDADELGRLIREDRLEAAAELAEELGQLAEARSLWERACRFDRASAAALRAGDGASA